MREDAATGRSRPWYREPAPWLLMLGPAIVVVAGVATLWLAVTSSDGLVADDYYKQGLGINQTLARRDLAKALALTAKLRVADDRVIVRLAANEGVGLPDRLRVTFTHPTRSGQDHVAILERSSDAYEGRLPILSGARWQVLLEDEGRTWLLAGLIRVPDEVEVELGGAQ